MASDASRIRAKISELAAELEDAQIGYSQSNPGQVMYIRSLRRQIAAAERMLEELVEASRTAQAPPRQTYGP